MEFAHMVKSSTQSLQDFTSHSGIVPVNSKVQFPQTNAQYSAVQESNYKSSMQQNCPSENTDDTTLQAIPKVIELLQDEDPVVVHNAAVLVQQLSKIERNKPILIAHKALIEALVTTLSTSQEPEIIRVITGCLHSLSQSKQGLRAICQNGGVVTLIQILHSTNCPVDPTTLHYAVTMLHNALLQETENACVKQAARSVKGAAALTKLLSRDNPKLLAIITDCLHFLCHGHNESKLAVVSNGGPQYLVKILKTYTYEKLLWTVSRLLKILSTCQQTKTAIIEAGGMHALTSQLSQPSSRLVMNCLWSLRNLSDSATKQTGLDHLMHFLLHVLSSVKDKEMVACAIGTLSNLTCNNQHNKIVICNAQGIETIVRMLSVFGLEQQEILEPSILTLRHLTSRHPGSEHAQSVFRNLGGLNFIAQLLATPWANIRPPIAKAACGLLRNFALLDANYPQLTELGCMHQLSEILMPASRELIAAAEAGLSAPKSQDGTKLDDLAEQAAAALHAMLKDPNCRQAAKQTAIPHTLMQLTNCKLISENTRKQAAGALAELVGAPQNIECTSFQHQHMNPSTSSQQQQQNELISGNTQQQDVSVGMTPVVYQQHSQPSTPKIPHHYNQNYTPSGDQLQQRSMPASPHHVAIQQNQPCRNMSTQPMAVSSQKSPQVMPSISAMHSQQHRYSINQHQPWYSSQQQNQQPNIELYQQYDQYQYMEQYPQQSQEQKNPYSSQPQYNYYA